MAKRKLVKLAFAIAAILLLFRLIYSGTHSRTIAEEAFRIHCYEAHDDYGSYTMVRDKVYLLGHYYDFSAVTPPGLRLGTMGFNRVYVTWLGTSDVRGLKGVPF